MQGSSRRCSVIPASTTYLSICPPCEQACRFHNMVTSLRLAAVCFARTYLMQLLQRTCLHFYLHIIKPMLLDVALSCSNSLPAGPQHNTCTTGKARQHHNSESWRAHAGKLWYTCHQMRHNTAGCTYSASCGEGGSSVVIIKPCHKVAAACPTDATPAKTQHHGMTLPDASCCCDVIVLDHHHVIQAHAVRGAPSKCHSPLVQQPQAWGCLAGVLDPGEECVGVVQGSEEMGVVYGMCGWLQCWTLLVALLVAQAVCQAVSDRMLSMRLLVVLPLPMLQC
jgi:hypothetical protein